MAAFQVLKVDLPEQTLKRHAKKIQAKQKREITIIQAIVQGILKRGENLKFQEASLIILSSKGATRRKAVGSHSPLLDTGMKLHQPYSRNHLSSHNLTQVSGA